MAEKEGRIIYPPAVGKTEGAPPPEEKTIRDLLQLTPQQRQEADRLIEAAITGDQQKIVHEHKRLVGPVNQFNRAIVENAAGFMVEKQIFARSDLYPGSFARILAEHEAIEAIYQENRPEASKIVEELGLETIQQNSVRNKERPEHYVALAHELASAQRLGLLDRYLSHKKLREEAELMALGAVGPKVTVELQNERQARERIAGLLTEANVASSPR